MKQIITSVFFIGFFFAANQVFAQDPIMLNKTDKEIYVQMSMDQDFTTYGYEKADKSSTIIICFSSMTANVEGNPKKCKLGSHYTSEEFSISYLGTEGNWIKAEAKVNGEASVFYLEKSAVVEE